MARWPNSKWVQGSRLRLRSQTMGTVSVPTPTFPSSTALNVPGTLSGSRMVCAIGRSFSSLRDSNGVVLNIRGPGIQPVEYPRGGDMRRLREARGADLTHHVQLDLPLVWDGRIGQNPQV